MKFLLVLLLLLNIEEAMSYYKDYLNKSHGFELYPAINNGFRKNENGVLFYAEYLLLRDMNGELTHEEVNEFNKIVVKLQTHIENIQIPGLYDRGAGESNPNHEFYVPDDKRRKISHDNLTAIAFLSHKLGYSFHKDIYRHGLKTGFQYDNTFSGKPFHGQVQIRDIIMYSILGGSWRAKLLAPIAGIANIISCLRPKEETSGKLLYFVRRSYKDSMILNMFNKVCDGILRYQYGKNYWEEIFKIYFKDKGHPNNVEAQKLYK